MYLSAIYRIAPEHPGRPSWSEMPHVPPPSNRAWRILTEVAGIGSLIQDVQRSACAAIERVRQPYRDLALLPTQCAKGAKFGTSIRLPPSEN